MIIEKEYGVPLTDAELLELSDEVAGFCRAIADKREEMKQQSDFLRQEIKELQAKLDDRLDRLQSKREVRFVRLNLEYNRPEPGKVEIYDAESGRLYETREMTEEERDDLLVRSESAEAPAEDPGDPGSDALEFASTDESGDTPVPDISDNEEEIVLEEGKYYRYRGQLFRAEKSGYKPCENCFFDDEIACPNVNCDQNEQILVPAENPDAPETPEDGPDAPETPEDGPDAPETPEDGPDAPEPPEEPRSRICSKCGAVRQGIEVYRMPNGRNLCAECLAKHRLAGLKKLDALWSRKVVKLFRVICSDDLSEFKFLSEKGGWENPIRFPGNARREDTEAGKFYRELYGRGGHEG